MVRRCWRLVWQVGGLLHATHPVRSFSIPVPARAKTVITVLRGHAIAPSTAIKAVSLQLNDCVCNAGSYALPSISTAPTGCCAGFHRCLTS